MFADRRIFVREVRSNDGQDLREVGRSIHVSPAGGRD
jgi:hypothetical protein